MRFGLSLIPCALEPDMDEWMLDKEVELGLMADDLGYDMLMIGERHFSGVGAGNPFMSMARIAPQLKQAWLGTGVVVVPNYHPVRLAEQMNIIDHYAKGKVITGLGGGMSPTDAVAFGFNISEQLDEMYHQSVETLLKLWDKKREDPPVKIDTVHYKGELLWRITPTPYRKPRPFVKTTVSSPEHIARAAREGWPVFILCRDADEAREPFTQYRRALLSHGHSPEVLDHCAEWTSIAKPFMHIAETDEQAAEEWQFLYDRSVTFRDRLAEYGARSKAIQGISEPTRGVEDRAAPTFRKQMTVHGGVDTIIAHVREMEEMGIGMFHLGINIMVDDVGLEMGKKAARLFAEKVIPHFRGPVRPFSETCAAEA